MCVLDFCVNTRVFPLAWECMCVRAHAGVRVCARACVCACVFVLCVHTCVVSLAWECKGALLFVHAGHIVHISRTDWSKR